MLYIFPIDSEVTVPIYQSALINSVKPNLVHLHYRIVGCI